MQRIKKFSDLRLMSELDRKTKESEELLAERIQLETKLRNTRKLIEDLRRNDTVAIEIQYEETIKSLNEQIKEKDRDIVFLNQQLEIRNQYEAAGNSNKRFRANEPNDYVSELNNKAD